MCFVKPSYLLFERDNSLYFDAMRILNLLPRIATPPVDGGAIAAHYPMLHLAKRGHSICTLAFNSNRHPQDPQATRTYSELYTVEGDFPEFSLKSAFRNLFDRRPYNLALRFARPAMHQLIRKVGRETPRPDIIQIDWVYMAEYLPTLRKVFPGVPVILRQHNAEHVIFRRLAANEANFAKKVFIYHQARKLRHYEKRALRKADQFVAITQTDEQLFRSLAPGARGCTIPAGVETHAFARPDGTPRDLGFLILGSLSWAPYAQAVQWFLEQVWVGFHKKNPEKNLYIVGSAPPPGIQKWNGTMGIHVTGFVEDIKPLMHRSSAMVVPLLSGSGMRVKIVEAMAASLPVISTSIGAEGIDVENGRHAIIADTPADLHIAMQQILDDDLLAEQLAENGLDLAKSVYEWTAIAERFEEVYLEMTHSK